MREEAEQMQTDATPDGSVTPPVEDTDAQAQPERKAKRVRGGSKGGDKAAEPALKFRNYNVRDDKIEHTVLDPAKPPEFKEPAVDLQIQNRPEVSFHTGLKSVSGERM